MVTNNKIEREKITNQNYFMKINLMRTSHEF